MGGSVGKSESEAENAANFDQKVWSGQTPALQDLYGQVGNLFGQTTSGMQGQTPGAVAQQQQVFDQSQPAWQQQMGGGAYQGMDLQGMYSQALQGGGNEQFIDQSIMGGQGNDYADAMKQQMQSDAWDRTGTALANIDQRAAGRGMGGSSRHGIVQADAIRSEQDRLGDMQTQLGYNTFDKDLDRKLGIAQRADQFDMGRLQNVGQQLGGQNAAMQSGLNYGQGMQNLGMGQFAPYMAPWQATGQYANAIGRPTVLGSGVSSGQSDSKGFGMSGGVGGGKG